MPAPFTIFPAIDLRGGKVVRLAQGDPERQTTSPLLGRTLAG